MNTKRRNVRRLRLVAGALLIVTAAAGAAHVAFADTSNPTPAQAQDATTTTGPNGNTTHNAFTAALEALVTRGVINQAQADAVQHQVLDGTVYPDALVADGTLSTDQMRQVVDSLAAVKRAYAGDTGTTPDQLPAPVNKTPPAS
jgi:hypothetical protein